MAERPETKSIIVTQAVQDYAIAHGTPPDDVQRSLIEATTALGGVSMMQIAPEQGAFMTLLTRLVGARFAVEVGTFTGYSSICIARGLAEGGSPAVLRRERGVDRDRAASTGTKAGVDDRIELRIGPAIDTLRALPADPPIDLAFIDADKTGYRAYYDEIVERLRPGGLVMLDNVLWSGNVVDDDDQSENTVALRAVNDHIAVRRRGSRP